MYGGDDKDLTMAQRNGRSEEEFQVKIKEEEIPVEIHPGTSMTQRNVKFEEEEEELHVKIKEEKVPVEISTGGYTEGPPTPPHPVGNVNTEDGLTQNFQEGKKIKVEVKEEVETSMEIGADGQYTRSVTRDMKGASGGGHVLPKPLSREEKLEILRHKLLENNRFPWVEGGCFPSNPRRDPNNPDPMEDIHTHRIGHTDWCSCGNCIPLPTGRESVCCMEIRGMRPHLEGISCITQHPYFPYLCENKDFAQIHQNMMYGLRSKIPKEKNKKRALRKAAYQAFSVWIHGALGKKEERPIPACTVHRVRLAFLGADYATAYKDYPAEHMIFC
ncbi:uncharacterized protein LOC120924757 isoform X2 [Rana temporaria]|uniref:uncharacterized protein LOC120924757 isoform X2 n=1 Tax=Rana temporaria TaxID=8407 RepID=UPI001AAC9ECB|nr:uncharacterized protein LOC120924757 isoform X2 [Rana temporaria]